MSATIELYPRFFQLTKADQIETIVHELCHCHTQAASNALARLMDGGALHGYHATEIIERLTQTMAMIALNLGSHHG
jgi:predicted metallopeptidase